MTLKEEIDHQELITDSKVANKWTEVEAEEGMKVVEEDTEEILIEAILEEEAEVISEEDEGASEEEIEKMIWFHNITLTITKRLKKLLNS